MSFESNQSVADPKALKNMIARFNTEDGIQSLVKAAGSVVAMDRFRAIRYIDLLSSYCQKQPLLLQCTPASIWHCMKTAASFGLEPGLLGMLYIVPFRNHGVYEAQVIIGYRGLVELTRRSKAVKYIEAFNVFEADLKAPGKFEVILGLKPDVIHVPNWRVSKNGQKPIGSYCVSVLADGDRTFTFMTQEEIEAIRQRSRAKDSGPWVTDPGEMFRKSVTRRHCKYLPVSIEDLTLMDAARHADFDVDPEELETKGGVPVPVVHTPAIEVSQTALPAEKAVEGAEAPAAPAAQEPEAPSAQEPQREEAAKPEEDKKPVAGTQGMKDAIAAKKRGRPAKKSGAEAVPPADVPQESVVGAQSPAVNTPAPAPEAPKAETSTKAETPQKAETPKAAPKWVAVAEEQTKETDDERIIRYEKELVDADEIPTAILGQRANFAWTHVGENDQAAILQTLGGLTVEQVMEQDSLKMRKNLIIASATVIKQRLMRAKAAAEAEKKAPAEPKAAEAKTAQKETEPADDPIAIKVNSLLEGHQQLDVEALRARAKQMLTLAKEVRPGDVKSWLYDLMLEEEDLDVIRQIGLRRMLETFAKNLTSKEE